jgi:pimeloyl-ACP methyl ester carboxylesterase
MNITNAVSLPPEIATDLPRASSTISKLAAGFAMLGVLAAGTGLAAETDSTVFHRSTEIQGVDVAYREAGSPDNPTVLLLHGFPTSSQMFRDLIPELAGDYHVLAPDYPGYGASEMPAREDFEYSFANMAKVVEDFLDAKGVDRFSVFLMDYGAPIGFRVFAKNPERVTGFIIQNGNAYDEGLEEFWDPIKAYWNQPSEENRNGLRQLLTIEATQWQYTHGVGNVEAVSPDNWHTDQYLLDRPGNQDIQLDMFYDYRTNVALYSKWQALFRKHQPPTLITWGRNDHIFPASGAHPYSRDLEDLEVHLLDTGHFALEEYGDFITAEIRDFLSRTAR